MALKILIASDDSKWVTDFQSFMMGHNYYHVDVVQNGIEAQRSMHNGKYFAIILSYDIQKHSAQHVLRFIKTHRTGQKVLLLVESEELLDKEVMTVDQLKKMGATEVIFGSVSNESLKEILESHQTLYELLSGLNLNDGISDEEEVNQPDDQFTKIKIDEFYSSKAVLFDVYVKLGSAHYVKILHAGDKFSRSRIDKYKNEKKMEYLYLQSKDRRKYIQYNNFLSSKSMDKSQISSAQKVNMLKNVSQKYIEEVFCVGLKPLVVEQGKEICQNVYALIEKHDDLYRILRDYSEFDSDSFTHAYVVTLFAGVIIKQFEWQSKIIIETTALSCMFHDIGKTKLPAEFLEKKVEDMNESELEQYQMHPGIGSSMMEGNVQIGSVVRQIILQHHETCDGKGFPNNLKRDKITILAGIVGLANDITHMVKNEKITPSDALKKIFMSKELIVKYNSLILEKFILAFTNHIKIPRNNILPSNSRIVPTCK